MTEPVRPQSAWVSKGYSFWPDDAVDLAPQKVQELYENKFCGCWRDPDAEAEVKAHIEANEGYGDAIAHKYGFADLGKGKLSLLFPYVEMLYPGCYPGAAQARGDCVSHGQKNANLLTLAAEVVSGAPDEVTGIVEGAPEVNTDGIKQGAFSTEAIYWMRGYNGDGWQCGSSAKVSTETMALWPRKDYPELGIDLTRYSGSLAGKYGSRRPPNELIEAGQKHLIRKFTALRSMEEVRDFIAAGFGINTCGGEGWSSSRDENGFSSRRGSWSHSMCVMGVDDRQVVHDKYGDMLVLIMNSWGRWNSGGRRILGTNIDIPEGSFWAKAKDCSRRSFHAMAGASGWPAKKLPPFTPLPLG